MPEQAAPVCPWWCTAEHGPNGWDDDEPTKRCTRGIPSVEDVDGEEVWVVLERFARIAGVMLVIDPPVIRIEGHGPLGIDEALAGALTVIRAVDMTKEPRPVQLAG